MTFFLNYRLNVLPEKNIFFSISLHLEGTPYNQVNNFDRYKQHLKAINQFTGEIIAQNPNARFNFELSNTFIQQDLLFGSTVFGANKNFSKVMKSKGHSILLHADIGGSDETNEQYNQKLQLMLNSFELLLGEKTRGISGICGNNNWIEALTDNDLKFVTGMVEYCKKSILRKNLRAEDLWITNCDTPGATIPPNHHPWDLNVKDCHGIFPELSTKSIRPITLLNSRNWLSNVSLFYPMKKIRLTPLIAFSNMQLPRISCLSNYVIGGDSCEEDYEDLIQFENRLLKALNIIQDYNYKNNYLSFTLSIGHTYSVEFSNDVGRVLSNFIDSNNITWQGVDDSYDLEIR